MEGFWTMIHGWPPIGQGFVLLLVAGATLFTVRTLGYYLTVAFRGWPPEHATPRRAENDEMTTFDESE